MSKYISQAFRCFEGVVKYGSIRQAALKLHLTAPAVHQQINNLEENIGALLFERTNNGMRLSAAGEIVANVVRKCQKEFDFAITQVQSLENLQRGRVKVGVSHSTAEHVIPRAILSMIQRFPGVSFSVRAGTGEAIQKWVADGDVDFGYCLQRKPHSGVQETKVWTQSLGVVLPINHPLLHVSSDLLRFSECLDYPIILPGKEMDLRSIIDNLVRGEEHRVNIVVNTNSVKLISEMVKNKVGISFLLSENVNEAVKEKLVKWLPLSDSKAMIKICLYQRYGHTLTNSSAIFLHYIEEVLNAEGNLPIEDSLGCITDKE